jgi:hypothetical protein
MGRNGHFPNSVYDLQKKMEDCREEHKSTLVMLSRHWISHALAKDANKHSVKIEYTGSSSSKVRDKRLYADMMRRQEIAWEYALESIGPEQNYTPKNLATIAQMLAPYGRYNPNTGFRVEAVTITGAPYSPPSPGKLEEDVNTLIERADHLLTLPKAIFSHYHIARIHPFADGNGRTARIIQNAITCGAGFLPINTRREQRDLYLSLLAETDKKYYSGDHDYLHTFSEFLVSNLKTSLKQARNNPLARLLF